MRLINLGASGLLITFDGALGGAAGCIGVMVFSGTAARAHAGADVQVPSRGVKVEEVDGEANGVDGPGAFDILAAVVVVLLRTRS